MSRDDELNDERRLCCTEVKMMMNSTKSVLYINNLVQRRERWVLVGWRMDIMTQNDHHFEKGVL